MNADGLSQKMTCQQRCPAGTKPSLTSLYYLNTDLFTEKEIMSAMSPDWTLAVDKTKITLPVGFSESEAIGLYGEPLFGNQKWTLVAGIPIFQSVAISLECMPCEYFCAQCAPLWKRYTDSQRCLFQTDCN